MKPLQPPRTPHNTSYGERHTDTAAAENHLKVKIHSTYTVPCSVTQRRPPRVESPVSSLKLTTASIGNQRSCGRAQTFLLPFLQHGPRANSGALVGAVRRQRQLQVVRASIRMRQPVVFIYFTPTTLLSSKRIHPSPNLTSTPAANYLGASYNTVFLSGNIAAVGRL